MKQLEFGFMNPYKTRAKELLKQMDERQPGHDMTLERLIKLVENYTKFKRDLVCDAHGLLYAR